MNKSIFLLIIVNISLYSQTPSSIELIGNMKEKILKPDGYTNVYFDLNNRSIIQLSEQWGEKSYEDYVGFDDSVVSGSFTNSYSNEYILILKWNYPENFSFPHVGNFGPLTQFVYFDSNYKQISKVFFHDATTELKDIIDIDNDGINEIFLGGMYCNHGVCMSWINIFYKDMTEPVLSYCSDMTVVSALQGEWEEGYTNYIAKDGLFQVDITRIKKLYLSEADSRIIKEETCNKIYKYSKGVFKMETGINCLLEGY